MYLSMPLLCSGCRNERNSSSFSSWSAGGLSAWNQRSFRLSRTSWAVVKPYFIHIIRNGFVTSTTPYLTNATYKYIHMLHYNLLSSSNFSSSLFFIFSATSFSLKPLLAKNFTRYSSQVTCPERAQFEKLAVKTIVKCYEIIMADVKNNIHMILL